MKQYKIDFIKLLIEAEALMFGEFTLKSGRVAPYFLNVGKFHTGEMVARLSKAYAEAYLDSGVEVDVIFGPAYKGIPLSVMTCDSLYRDFQKNVSYCFNRKEAKNYGDAKGKALVGAPIEADTRLMLVDDVITAGTAIRDSMELLKDYNSPKVEGILIAMDRMEKNNDGINAIKALEDDYDLKVYPIVNLDDVIEVLKGDVIDDEMMEVIKKYRAEYGV